MSTGADRLADELARMATISGITGCALVEIEAGMVWCTGGRVPDVQNIAEAASDYWRLYLRSARHFASLGNLRGSLMWHEQGQLVLLPCGDGVLLVALAQGNGSVDWPTCFARTQELAHLVNRA